MHTRARAHTQTRTQCVKLVDVKQTTAWVSFAEIG